MSEFLVFEANIPEKFFVSCSIKSPNFDSVLAFDIRAVSIIETMMSSTPYLQLDFVDGGGYLMSKFPVLPDDEFILTYGLSTNSPHVSRFKISTIEYDSMSSSDTGSVTVSTSLLHNNWDKIFKKSHKRSWKNKSYGDVITELAEEIGFDEIDVEPTLNTYDIIQPYWTNAQFIRWISENSINEEDIGGYLYGMTADNNFFFKTYDSIYSQASGTVTKYLYDPSGAADGIEHKGFNDITINNRYMPVLSHNGFGTESTYFDYNTKQYVNKTELITDMNDRQLSDWYYLAKSHNEASSFYDGGRNMYSGNNVKNKILKSTNSVHQMSIYVSGDPDAHIGDIIELDIPVAKNFDPAEDGFINQQYSGYWMIWKVVQEFDIHQRRYLSKLYLSRSGLNGLSILGLVQTPIGKSVS